MPCHKVECIGKRVWPDYVGVWSKRRQTKMATVKTETCLNGDKQQMMLLRALGAEYCIVDIPHNNTIQP